MMIQTRRQRLERIKKHIRKTVRGTTERPRLTVYRSLNHLYAQLVDDSRSRTIATVSTLSKEIKPDLANIKNKKEIAMKVGEAVARKAKEQNVSRVVFDRNGYLYHGIVKALAEGARKGGLEF